MVLGILTTVFCLVVGLIFWINPLFASDESLAPVVIVSVPLFGCVILWVLVLQYAIRLCLCKRVLFFLYWKILFVYNFIILVNELKTIVVIVICVDGLLEALAACLIISSNFYCSGYSLFSEITGFNYSGFLDY